MSKSNGQAKQYPIGELCKLINGRAFKPSEWTTTGLPIIRIQNLNDTTKEFNYFDGEYSERHEVNDGELLFSWSGTPGTSFGAFFWNRGKAVLNQHIFRVLVEPDRVDKDYFRYAMNSRLDRIINQAHGGVGLKHITKGKLEAVTVPLPPLSEQKRIAGILDKADSIRRKRQQAIGLTEQFLRSTFLDMFGTAQQQLSEAGPDVDTANWIRCPLGDQITLQRGVDITKKDHRDGDVPVISSGGLSGYHDEAVAKGPSVILGRKGSVGSVHFVDCDYWPHDTTLWTKELNSNSALYVYYFFREFPISRYEASTANPSLNRNNLHPVKVWWPPNELQERFESVYRRCTSQMSPQLEQSRDSANNLFNSLVQRAFRGEL